MKFKKRIKNALAGFLKEELLEHVGYNHDISFRSLGNHVIINNVPFEDVFMERVISIPDLRSGNHLREIDDSYEHQLSMAKQEFTQEILNHIHVDHYKLISHEDYSRRSIRLSLRLQKKLNNENTYHTITIYRIMLRATGNL